MTSILAIESGKLNCVVEAKRDSTVEGTAIGIKKGDRFYLKTLVYAMLLESGNDAAVLVAEYLAGSEEDFAKMMNKKAAEIGMTSTNFVTASGLDNPEHYTTAYDMALLGSYAVNNPVFRQICSTKVYTAEYISPEISSTYSNHNRLLRSYDGVFGIKTGFTKKSGRCLVTACKKNGAVLVAVTLNAPDDWNDHKKMFDYGFTMMSDVQVPEIVPDTVRVYSSKKQTVEISLSDTDLAVSDCLEYDYRVAIPKLLYAPIRKNEVIGYLEILSGDRIVKRIEILTDEAASIDTQIITKPQYSFCDKLKHLFLN